MKILILTDSFNYCCGRSRHIVTLAKSLQDAGHYVFVVFGGGDGSGMLESLKIPYEVISEVLHSKRSYLNFIRGIIKIYKIQKEKNFDIIHAHHHYASNIARLAVHFLKVPLIMTIHGSVKGMGILPVYAGDYYIAVSDETKKFAIKENQTIKNRIISIPNGVEIDYNNYEFDEKKIKADLGFDNTSIVISIIGRIVYHKGHKILLDAISKLKTNITCLIVGGGDYEEAVRNEAAKKKFKSVFTGKVKDTSDYFKISDIVVIPSLCCEGLPITLLEAGKFEKPVIASSIDGIKNIITNKQNGILISPDSTDELFDALKELVVSKDLREKLGKNLHKTVETSFTKEIMTSNTLKVYEKIINREII
jgi:glycosyltransferase involved in cell wall biosynthesis